MATKINMRFSDTVVPVELNDTETARALAKKPPATVCVIAMKRKALVLALILALASALAGCADASGSASGASDANLSSAAASQSALQSLEATSSSSAPGASQQEVDRETPVMKMNIGGFDVAVEWESNESVAALAALAADGPLTVEMSMHGGFEQFGSLGATLPSNDVQTTTGAGDIVLYSSNQIVVFYGSNSWAYTRLGHITDRTPEELADLLGNGNITLTITAE